MAGHYKDFVSVKAEASWRGLGLRASDTSPGRFESPPSPDIRILMHLGEPSDLECEIDNKTERHIQVRGDITLVPAGASVSWVDHDHTSTMSLFLSHHLMSSAAADLGVAAARWKIRPVHKLRDPRLFQLGLLMKDLAESEEDQDPIFIESLAATVAVRMLGEHGYQQKGSPPEVDARCRIQAALDFIDSNLASELPLKILAARAMMSVSHFQNTFRKVQGVPVHQYVIERRTLRARALLESGCASLSQVALETGFCHQSHMSKYIQRRFGVPPSALIGKRA